MSGTWEYFTPLNHTHIVLQYTSHAIQLTLNGICLSELILFELIITLVPFHDQVVVIIPAVEPLPPTGPLLH